MGSFPELEQYYRGCYVGVDLPVELRGELEDLRGFLKTWVAEINDSTPGAHITVYYLGKVAESVLAEARRTVEKHVSSLQGLEIEIGGYKFFDNLFPALCLAVKMPSAMLALRNALEESLGSDIRERNLPYDPHLTVAEIKTDHSLNTCRRPPQEMLEYIDFAKWTFLIQEISVVGKMER